MALRTYNPKTPGTRQLVLVDRSTLYKGKPVKALTEGKNHSGGRNANGRTTVRFRGGGRDGEYVIVRLNSGEQRLVHGRCMATVGAVSNPDHMNISIGKAGRMRWMGRRPHNRGVSMNPIDHPHGGGEGRTSGGRHPVTPWGFPTKGKKTRRNKSTTKFIISSRHARKKKK